MAASQQQVATLSALTQLAVQEQLQRVRVPVLSGGQRSDKAAVDLELNESPSIVNLTLITNQLVVDTGYGVFGTALTGSFLGTPHVTYQVFNADGTASELLITTKTVYALDTALFEWKLVPFGSYLSNNAQINAGAVSAVFASLAGVSIGSMIGLPLDDGTQLAVTATNVAGTTLTWDTPIPAGRHVVATASVVLAIKLNGTLLQQPVIVTFAAKEWTIITNNVDPLFYFDGAKLVALGGLPTATTCQSMIVFHESLFLLNTIENGQSFPQRVRMSDIGDPQAWTPGVGSTIAAIYDLLDTEDFIHTGTIVGPYLVLFRETTIMRGTYLGQLNNTMFWEYMIYGEGVASVTAVSEIGAEQEFVGNGNVYQYDGGYTLQSVGDGIYQDFLSAIGDLNAERKDLLFTQYVPDYDEFWLFYPAGQSQLPNKMLRQSLEKTGWFVRQFANAFVSAAPYIPLTTVTWASAAGSWASQSVAWNSRIFLANVPSIVLCAADTNQVFIYDYKTQADNGSPISWSFETKDIAPGDEFERWDSVRLYGQGTALVEYSLDGGASFVVIGTAALGLTKSLKMLYFQAVSSYIRFRVSGTDPKFVFNWLECWFFKESDW